LDEFPGTPGEYTNSAIHNNWNLLCGTAGQPVHLLLGAAVRMRI